MRRALALGTLLAAGTLVLAATSRPPIQEPRAVTIQSMDVRENLYVISGGGGHTAALVTEADGVVLVDTKLAGWGQSILEAVQAITSQPVTVIINTHTHGDHVGGNVDFPATVEIVAHENAATRMAAMDAFAGAGAQFLPDRTFGDRMTLFEGHDRIDLYHFGAGHTDGDTVVVFPALGTAHMGDLFAFLAPPYIDVGNGGSGVAYPDTLDRILASIEGVRRVIPGHIPPPPGSPMRGWTTWNDLREYARFQPRLSRLGTRVEGGWSLGRRSGCGAGPVATIPRLRNGPRSGQRAGDLQRAGTVRVARRQKSEGRNVKRLIVWNRRAANRRRRGDPRRRLAGVPRAGTTRGVERNRYPRDVSGRRAGGSVADTDSSRLPPVRLCRRPGFRDRLRTQTGPGRHRADSVSG